MAEEALASLSGRLIDAQEEERKRISREIHDDYSQRLAVLAIDLEDVAEKIGDSLVEAGQTDSNKFGMGSANSVQTCILCHTACTLPRWRI